MRSLLSYSRAAGRLRIAQGSARQEPIRGCTRACLPASDAIAAASPYRLLNKMSGQANGSNGRATVNLRLSGKALLGLKVRRFHDALRIGDILREEFAEVLRAPREEIGALARKALAHLGGGERLRQRGLHPL